MPADLIFLIGFSFLLLIYAIYYFDKYNDEIPVFISFLNLLFLWRLIAVHLGIADWVSFNYGINFDFNIERGTEGFSYIISGMYLVVGSYCFFRKHTNKPPIDSPLRFEDFLHSKCNIIIWGLIIGPIITSLSYASLAGGSNFSQSYTWLFPFFRASMIILGWLLLINKKKLDITRFCIIAALLVVNISTTLVPSGRFVLIAWGIAFITIFSEVISGKKRLLLYTIMCAFFMLLFSTLGLLRHEIYSDLSLSQLLDISLSGFLKFNDLNMIDGFIMLLQVYPKYLDFSYGMGHLEILMRPIPRAIWQDKPVGGWQQKFAVSQAKELYGENVNFLDTDLYGTGISPTIFGDFYAEGGLLGIITLSIFYGWVFAKLINFSDRYSSYCRLIIKAILLASLFPLFRGGDLPGITAFILLAFWPIILFVYSYNKKLKKYARA